MASKKLDISNLCTAVARSRMALRTFREERVAAVRQYVGPHYSEETAGDKRRPGNLLSLYISIVMRSLVAKNPRFTLSTFQREQKPTIAAMQGYVNKQIVKMGFQTTLQRFVLDSLFSIGIGKVALATPSDAAAAGWSLEAGKAFFKLIDLDDWVCDMQARDFEECTFLGHRYRVPIDTVRDSSIYTQRRKDLTASVPRQHNAEGDDTISMLGGGRTIGWGDEFIEHVDLWEIYCPREGCLYVISDDDLVGPSGSGCGDGAPRFLREFDWIGPDRGPFHYLGHQYVPGNCMTKGPIQDLLDLDSAFNRGYRKLIAQHDREKVVTLVTGGANEDGTRVMEASDGQMIRVDNPDATRVITSGGITPVGLAGAKDFRELFVYLAGNLDMMGGLGTQSPTATQDKMLESNSSKTIADMQDKVVGATSSIGKALCWFWYHDPDMVMSDYHEVIPGFAGLSTVRKSTPQDRIKGRWDDVEFTCDPYSMAHSTPQGKLAVIKAVVEGTIIPLAQILERKGIAFDIEKYLELIAQFTDIPEIADMTTLTEPIDGSQGTPGDSGDPTMPQSTNREYTRHNVSTATRDGQERNMVSQLMTGNSQGGNQANKRSQMAGA